METIKDIFQKFISEKNELLKIDLLEVYSKEINFSYYDTLFKILKYLDSINTEMETAKFKWINDLGVVYTDSNVMELNAEANAFIIIQNHAYYMRDYVKDKRVIEAEIDNIHRKMETEINKHIDSLRSKNKNTDTLNRFPKIKDEKYFKDLNKSLIENNFINKIEDVDFLYWFGYSEKVNASKIEWKENVQLAREFLVLLYPNSKLKVSQIEKITPQVFIKNNYPLKLSKNKHVDSTQSDKIKGFFAT